MFKWLQQRSSGTLLFFKLCAFLKLSRFQCFNCGDDSYGSLFASHHGIMKTNALPLWWWFSTSHVLKSFLRLLLGVTKNWVTSLLLSSWHKPVALFYILHLMEDPTMIQFGVLAKTEWFVGFENSHFEFNLRLWFNHFCFDKWQHHYQNKLTSTSMSNMVGDINKWLSCWWTAIDSQFWSGQHCDPPTHANLTRPQLCNVRLFTIKLIWELTSPSKASSKKWRDCVTVSGGPWLS